MVQWKMTKRNSSSSVLNFPLNHDGGRISENKREGLNWNTIFFTKLGFFIFGWRRFKQYYFILHTTSSRNKKGRENHGSMVHITIDSSMNQIEKLPNKKTVSLHCRFVPQRHHFQKLPLQWVPFFRQFLEFSEGLGQLLRDCEAHHLCYWQGLVSLGGGGGHLI